MIVWNATKAHTGIMLDRDTHCWLRTRFGSGALRADGFYGVVDVSGKWPSHLEVEDENAGGRRAEVVNAAA